MTRPHSNPLVQYLPWLFGAVVLVAAPHVFTSGSARTMLSLMGIMIVFSLSYNMLLGQAGMLSFGHAVYYGLGGYLAVHAMNYVIRNKFSVPVPLIPLAGGFMGLLFGVIFGSVSTRRAGTAFAMISLGLGELVASSALILRGFFGGEDGITTNRTKLFRMFDLNFGPQIQVYYLIAAWCFVCIVAMYAITRTPFGRMCNAVRDNPERAEFVGYNTQRVRFIAFCISGFFAGIAGGLAAINFEIMNAITIGGAQSGIVLIMSFIGGVGNFFGPIIGAILITLLQVSLSDITGAWQLYFGLLFIFVVMFAPGGIAGVIMLHEPLWRSGQLPRLVVPYAIMALPSLAIMGSLSLCIEMAHHLLVKAAEGPSMAFLHIPLEANAPLPWLVVLLLGGGGLWSFRRLRPRVADAWNDALMQSGILSRRQA